MGAALLYTAVVTPYAVAFLEPSLDALFWIDRIVDLVFVTVRGCLFPARVFMHLLVCGSVRVFLFWERLIVCLRHPRT